MSITAAELASAIDHTILTPQATDSEVDAMCDQALEYGFGGICVNPRFVQRVANRLARASLPANAHRPIVVSVTGFPLGASRSDTKADEAARAMDDGAGEIDMVALIGALIDGDGRAVRRDIEAVARAVHQADPPGKLKVILEVGALSTDRIILGCRCCAEGEADFVKTSTGMHASGGATVEHVRLLRRCAAPLGVKAAGGIRTADQAIAMLNAGACRIGTSSGITIVQELTDRPT